MSAIRLSQVFAFAGTLSLGVAVAGGLFATQKANSEHRNQDVQQEQALPTQGGPALPPKGLPPNSERVKQSDEYNQIRGEMTATFTSVRTLLGGLMGVFFAALAFFGRAIFDSRAKTEISRSATLGFACVSLICLWVLLGVGVSVANQWCMSAFRAGSYILVYHEQDGDGSLITRTDGQQSYLSTPGWITRNRYEVAAWKDVQVEDAVNNAKHELIVSSTFDPSNIGITAVFLAALALIVITFLAAPQRGDIAVLSSNRVRNGAIALALLGSISYLLSEALFTRTLGDVRQETMNAWRTLRKIEERALPPPT